MQKNNIIVDKSVLLIGLDGCLFGIIQETITLNFKTIMRKNVFLLIMVFCSSIIYGQVSKTVNLDNYGDLASSLTSEELKTVTHLTITGNMGQGDFTLLADDMPSVEVVDLSGATVEENKMPTDALAGIETLKSVSLPASLEVVGIRAFAYCSALESVTFGEPSSLTEVGWGAFSYCSKLQTFTFPESVTSIDEYMFRSCYELTSVVLPSSITEIRTYTFNGCVKLKSVNIPNTIETIGSGAFGFCESLDAITLPESLTTIESYAFEVCTSLVAITLPPSLEKLGYKAFQSCQSLKEITVPASVTEMGEYCFSECENMTKAVINASIDTLKSRSFYYCEKLLSVELPEALTTIEEEAFYACFLLPEIKIPEGVVSVGDDAYVACRSATTITIPASVKSIGQRCFYGCEIVESIFANGTTPPEAGWAAFADINMSNCAVYVPDGSVESYKTAEEWSEFANILLEGEKPKYLQLSGENVFLEDLSGSFEIVSNSEWTVQTSEDWLTFDPASGSGDATVTVTADKPVAEKREAYVVVEANGVESNFLVFQYASEVVPELITDADNVVLSNGTATVVVTSDVTWTASSDESWLTIDVSSGYLELSAQQSDEERTATVTIQPVGGEVKEIRVVVPALGSVAIGETEGLSSKYRLFPNPVKNLLSVTGEGNKQIKVMNSQGTLLVETELGENEFVDIADLVAGLYIVSVSVDGEMYSFTFLKQ